MPNGKIRVNSENIFPIIKKWLYTDQDIFIRELVSNACDAVTKHQKLTVTGDAPQSEQPYAVNITVSKKGKTVTFSDNGIGMTEEEVDTYINRLAFSGAEDFVARYAKADASGIIGHFGLGFYSAFIVADRVDLETLSYQEGAKPVLWTCDGSVDFSMQEGERQERGTSVTLHIGDEGKGFLDYATVLANLKKYCAFLPTEITLLDADKKDATPTVITEEPLFMKPPKDITDEQYKAFYKAQCGDWRDPLFWVHLSTDFPFAIRGIVYFPEITGVTQQNEGKVKVFNNRVYVSDGGKDLIPEYLNPFKGLVDCADMPLNVSRSSLQNRSYWQKVRTYLIKKTAEKLKALLNASQEEYAVIYEKINGYLKYGAVTDEEFYKKIKDVLLLKGTDGTTDKLVDLLPQKPEKAEDADKPETPAAAPKKIYYTDSESGMGVYASAYAARGTKVYLLDQAIDTHFVLFLEQHEQGLRFARIDSDFDALQKKEDAQADAAPDTADLIKAFESVAGEGVKVEARELDSELPCLLISAENATRMHTMSKIMGLPESGYRDLQLVVNTASPVVKKLAAAPDRELTAHCYDLARLSAGVLDVKDITAFVQRAAKLL